VASLPTHKTSGVPLAQGREYLPGTDERHPITSSSAATAYRLSRWVRPVLGVVTIGLGLWVLFRPFASLTLLVVLVAIGLITTGLARFLATEDPTTSAERILGGVWIAAGVAVVLWPNLTVRMLTFVVAIYLIVDGIGDILTGIRRGHDQRLAALLMGVATVMFGVLALLWPDITVLVIALVFSARLIIFGVAQLISTFQAAGAIEEKEPGRIRRFGRTVGALLAVVAAGGLALLSSQLRSGEPVVDDFYAAPENLPSEPGVLLRTEDFDRGIPHNARAWRILYTTTRDEGVPAVASGIVVVPEDAEGALPAIAWSHGTTGVDETCAPSILQDGFETGAFFALDEVIDQGWAIVATDYVGLGTEGPHPYLIGQGQARSVLDSVRAARQMDEFELEERTIVWGHSQGGNAALWTGVLAPSYAPDVNVQGVAALAPASDLVGLMDALPTVPGGNIFAAYTVSAYADTYEDVDMADYVVPGGQETIREISDRCLAEPAMFVSILSSLAVDFSVFRSDLDSGPLGERFEMNTPPFEIEAPLLLAQGAADSLVKPEVQAQYVADMCASGQQVDYRTYEGLDHVPLVEADSPLIPELVEWTNATLEGADPISSC
jgi:uncharacterized membrane protein HdeD (DUF308 family)/pimeloyl-ACP methyl ester carboxylesterase